MTVSNGKLVIEIARPQRRKRCYALNELVADIRPDNRHDAIVGRRLLATKSGNHYREDARNRLNRS